MSGTSIEGVAEEHRLHALLQEPLGFRYECSCGHKGRHCSDREKARESYKSHFKEEAIAILHLCKGIIDDVFSNDNKELSNLLIRELEDMHKEMVNDTCSYDYITKELVAHVYDQVRDIWRNSQSISSRKEHFNHMLANVVLRMKTKALGKFEDD